MDHTLPRTNRPKSRQSIAHVPSQDGSTARENATEDVSALQKAQNAEKKRLRGKSMGPGGIEALKDTTGNTAKQRPTLQVKSILKPSIPLTPPKTIPSFDELRKRNTGKERSPSRPTAEELLIDFSTPGPMRTASTDVAMTGAENLVDPFSPIRAPHSPSKERSIQNGEHGLPQSMEEREHEERRLAEKKAILDRRAERRKSMANRRVSFAPEATLHTWNVIELAEDSTTSSGSGSTRRQSSMTAAQSSKTSASPSAAVAKAEEATPPEQPEELLVHASPAQPKKRRRSSTGRPNSLDEPPSPASSSPSTGTGVIEGSSPVVIEDSIHSEDEDDDDLEVAEDSAMSVDDSNVHTSASDNSNSSTQSSLDDRLRKAANTAGTRGIAYDEHGDSLPTEMATDTITHAFEPWVDKKDSGVEYDLSAMQDQENANPFAASSKPWVVNEMEDDEQDEQDETQDMSMDVTKAAGTILPKASSSTGRRMSIGTSRRKSMPSRQSFAGELDDEDVSMDFTTIGGGILQREEQTHKSVSTALSDEDMTMEFTNVVGGPASPDPAARRESTQSMSMSMDDNETMDMTAAVGGILETIEERTEPRTDTEDETTTAMEMTKVVGAILSTNIKAQPQSQARQLVAEEGGHTQLRQSPRQLPRTKHPAISPRPASTPPRVTTSIASETGSPSLALKTRSSSRKQSLDASKSASASTTPKQPTSTIKLGLSKQSTPTKQLTPNPNRAETPSKTPIIPNVTHRSASPKKLFREELQARASPASAKAHSTRKQGGLFDRNEHTGQHTPSVVLHAPKPHQHLRRRSSGIGIDKEGMGSPTIAAIIDQRSSLGDAAFPFVPHVQRDRTLTFDDPKKMEEEVDAERAEDERRESGRFIMEQEADEAQAEAVAVQLKDMIESMTPKKDKPNKLRGRKSLAVGAAKGLLGKRPAELDEDDEDGEHTPKRLRAVERESSPVKNVRLPQPPTKDETTGWKTGAKGNALRQNKDVTTLTPVLSHGLATAPVAPSPEASGRFKDLLPEPDAGRPASFEDKLDNVLDAIDASTTRMQSETYDDPEQEKISLQDFLNMTNIHFIELSTTKRRHTMMPGTPAEKNGLDLSHPLEASFVAAAMTLPLLELYQHATRELKSYISTGRKIIRTIEAETLKEQPPLFREYIDARPDVKAVMDNQFRNGKTNARLQSKAGWYAWREQLVDGLCGGIQAIKRGMEEDSHQLDEQEAVLSSVLPSLTRRHADLTVELSSLERQAEELSSIDQEALSKSREQLEHLDGVVTQRSALLGTLQQQMQDKDDALAAVAELKVEMQDQIEEADRVHAECQTWSVPDATALKTRVHEIQRATGWSLTTAEEAVEEPNRFGVALTMTYKNELRLFFYPSAFQTQAHPSSRRRSGRNSRSVSGPNAPISLAYSPEDPTSSTLPTEKRFFLQLIRAQLASFSMLPQNSITARTVLTTVANGWDLAFQISSEIRLLDTTGISTVSIVGDEKLSAKVMLCFPGKSKAKARVDMQFTLHVSVDQEGSITCASSVAATPVYGWVVDVLTSSKSKKVQAALVREVQSKPLGKGAWVSAVRGLEGWIKAQSVPKTPLVEVSLEATALEPAPTPAPSSVPMRSPLTVKRTNVVQKRAIPVPVPQQRPEKARVRQVSVEKENIAPQEPGPRTPEMKKHVDVAMDLGVSVAIPPEQQEMMMHQPSPMKRVGALRRSPIGGGGES